MNYSFISPSKKTLLKKVSRIWWGYIFLTLFIFVGFVVMLKIQGYFMQNGAIQAINEQKTTLEEYSTIFSKRRGNCAFWRIYCQTESDAKR